MFRLKHRECANENNMHDGTSNEMKIFLYYSLYRLCHISVKADFISRVSSEYTMNCNCYLYPVTK